MIKDGFRPLSFWSFNGDMEDEEIRVQIRQLKEQGYGGFFMHARAGMILEYLGEDWFHACRVAVVEAEKQGMQAWLYDENGWPSGFAGGLVPALGEDYTAKHLYFIWREPKKSDGKVLAAYKKLEDGNYKRVHDEGHADLYCCLGQLKGYTDLLNPKAMDAFLCFTHQRYKEELGEYFGTVIPGIFTDEPQLVGKFPFTFAYPEEFRSRYGYDFWDKAWMLCMDGIEYAAFKYEAAKLVAELLRTNFTQKINTWCAENHLQFTGHFSNEDGLCDQTNANYNLMGQYGEMARPGIDFLGRRLTSPVLVKQISDAAYLAGKRMITSESFGCSGWDVTFNDLFWIADWQAAFGINSIVTHLSAYSMKGRRKRDYPAFFSYQEPWWEVFKTVSERIANVNTFLSEGRRDIKLLVIYPITSMWCMLAGTKKYSDESRHISNQFRLLIENLLDLQKDFLIVTEEGLEKFKEENGQLCYRDICVPTVIVPDGLSLNGETYHTLGKLANAGGNVLFINRRPILCEGVKTEAGKQIESHVIGNRRGLLEKYFLTTKQIEDIQVVDGVTGRAAEGIILTKRILENETRVFVMNPSRSDTKHVYLKVKDKYVPLTLTPTESVCLIVGEDSVREANESMMLEGKAKTITQLTPTEVRLLSPNAYTVNHCDVYLNNELLCKNVIPATCADEVYQSAYERGPKSEVRLVYSFEANFRNGIPEDMTLVAESEGVRSICINGTEVLREIDGWWIDKSFSVFPIQNYTQNGTNVVEILFEIVRPKELEEQGDFEGYRNRFFYPVEPEDIYIRGRFDVEEKGRITEGIEALLVNGRFVLTDATEKQAGELTKQNLWFYRGNVKFSVPFEAGSEKYAIYLEDFSGTAAEVYVNGKKAGVICRAPYRLDVSDYTIQGENILELILYGSNRNLLGPHHHISENPHFVGVPTFLGKKGFTDFIYPQIVDEDTHVDRYSFVKFSCGRIILEER